MSAYMLARASPEIICERSLSAPPLKSRSYASLPSTLNSDAATSRPTLILSRYPAFSVASMRSSMPETASIGGAKPPSSPMRVASPPYFCLMMPFKLWKTSQPSCMASRNDSAPVGMMKNSWNARALPACSPPLMTLKHGVGNTTGSGLPARSAKCWYNGTPRTAAPALAAARDTPKIALAPRLLLFSVPSRLIIKSSMARWSVGSLPTTSLARMSFTLVTA
mmetsp:Transcript_2984/g.4507  ORF Transcript_2984/g.4507 Transcript_2984/m.4507 type:complete len:222 (-) Transcript_2984:18-683(-)